MAPVEAAAIEAAAAPLVEAVASNTEAFVFASMGLQAMDNVVEAASLEIAHEKAVEKALEGCSSPFRRWRVSRRWP